MENLIRIKLDPRRGGLHWIPFRKPSFRISNWRSSEVEIWKSENGGILWSKLDESTFVSSWDSSYQRLYLTLLFDISTVTHLAFFDINGSVVSVGFMLEKSPIVPVGWAIESWSVNQIPVGWSLGSSSHRAVPCGHTLFGPYPVNANSGFAVKSSILSNNPAGFILAAPNDNMARAGYHIGTNSTSFISCGACILGLFELPVNIRRVGDSDLDALSSEFALPKQKLIALMDDDPAELD